MMINVGKWGLFEVVRRPGYRPFLSHWGGWSGWKHGSAALWIFKFMW